MRKLQTPFSYLSSRLGLAAGRRTDRWRRSSRHQSGMAVGELLVLTVPMCVLCMAVASKLSATASVRVEGQWRTALAAQKATTKPCGMDDTDWTMTAPIGVALAGSKVRKAAEPLAVSLLPKPEPLPFVSKKKVEQPTPARSYFYKRAADRAVADGINQVTTSATFVCNEPQHGDDRRDLVGYKGLLLALGHWQAYNLFNGGGGEADPTSNLPQSPDLCEKGGTSSGTSPCDVLQSGSGQ